MKSIRFLIKPTLLFLLITILSCEKEALFLEEPYADEINLPTPINIFNAGFSLENFNDPINTVKNNVEIQWENYTTKTIAETLWYEFGTTQQQKADMVSEFQGDNQYKLLASVDENNRPYYFMAKLAPQKGAPLQQFSYLYPEHFTGTVSLYDLQGQVVFLEYYKDGIIQHTIQDTEASMEIKTPFGERCMQRGTAMAHCTDALSCAFSVAAGESTDGSCGSGGTTGGSFVTVRTDHYTDWYNVRGDGTADYSHTQFNGSSYEYVYVPGGNNYSNFIQNVYNYYNTTHGEYGGYYTEEPLVNEEPQRIILDKSLKNTKAHCVYANLEALSGGFRNAIKQFDGEFPVAHLQFIMEDLGTTRAETRAPDNYNLTDSPDFMITIALNNNSNEHGVDYRPNLMTAKTIAHEIIHAEMYRKLLSLANQGNLNFTGWSRQQQVDYMVSIKDNFPGIYDYMRRHKNWQHQQMATHYRETIASILKEFDNAQHSDQFYMDLAWEGLKYPNIYTWSSQSQEEKDRIINLINDYIETHKNQNCSL